MLNYMMFLDDERFPPDNGEVWIVVRNMAQAVACVRMSGLPLLVSFDHDLGENERTGYDFAKWLIESDLDGIFSIENMQWTVHSQNPVGAKNIEKILENFYKVRYNR